MAFCWRTSFWPKVILRSSTQPSGGADLRSNFSVEFMSTTAAGILFSLPCGRYFTRSANQNQYIITFDLVQVLRTNYCTARALVVLFFEQFADCSRNVAARFSWNHQT